MSASPGSRRRSLPSQLLHDLRSPLNQIIGYSEMLAETDAREKKAVGDLERIRAAGQQMLALIDENFSADDAESFRHDRPRSSAADPRPRPADRLEISRAAPAKTVAPGRVLVVDDDENNREVLSQRLVIQGHTVDTAVSGGDALKKLHDLQFELVLLDIMMPDMDGHEVLRQIKSDESLHHIPVIMMSAVSEVESVVRCIEAGADDYLTKPFDPTLLKARVGARLEAKRSHDRETTLFEQLQQNYRKMQEVEKLRDDMRRMIVHDLRTPLTSVIAGVEMLEKHGLLNDAQREMMAIASNGGRTLLGMINDLLDVEKMEAGSTTLQYVPLSPSTLVAGAIAQVSSLAEESNTELKNEISSSLPQFEGDENKLSRTLVNLIANAIKFTRGGSVTISASHDHECICFKVRDTGEGIPAEAFDRIFEKFGQLDSRRIGTGLGLVFCKLAVEAHHGHISVESTVGAGSTFVFTIPLARG